MSENNSICEINDSASTESIWELSDTKLIGKGIQNGFKLCTDLEKFIQERADIEKAYAKSLHQWSQKWSDIIGCGPEKGTIETAWKEFLVAADTQADIHFQIKNNLCIDLVQKIQQWQKENYHKTLLSLKESKDVEIKFRNVQKQWEKLCIDIEKTKINYHSACKSENSTITILEKNVADIFSSSGEFKRVQNRIQKTEDEVRNCRDKYMKALNDIKNFEPFYMQEMTNILSKCKSLEEIRLKFFKDMFAMMHQHLNVSLGNSVQTIYSILKEKIESVDVEKDLHSWSKSHGQLMVINTPKFIEFNNKRDIAELQPATLSNQLAATDSINNAVQMALTSCNVTSSDKSGLFSKFWKLLPSSKSTIIHKDQRISDALQQYFASSKKIMIIEL